MNLTNIKEALNAKEFEEFDAYICSPYRGDAKKNTKAAKNYCRYAIQRGYSPICPHLFFTQFLDDSKEEERQLGLGLAKRCIGFCDEFFVFLNENRTISEGMQGEIEYAQEQGKKITFVSCEEVTAALEDKSEKQ